MLRLLSLLIVIALLTLSVSPVTAQESNYVVQTGDTLLQIAIKFNTSIAALKLANNLVSDLIFIGQTLKIPGVASSTTIAPTTVAATPVVAAACPQQYSVKSGDTLKIISERCNISLATLIAANQLLNPDLIFVGQTLVLPTGSSTVVTTASPCGASYTVQRGDFLNAIAEKCKVALVSLISANNLINANLIYAGQTLIMPGTTNTVAPAASATPVKVVATATSSPLIIGGAPLNNPTATPKPATSGSGATVNASRGVVGELTLCNPEKPTFAIKIERICFRLKITNTTGNKINYSILGVQATNLSGGANQFQSSWRGDLSLAPNSVGPTGSGWEDGIYIQNAGTYALQLAICYAVTDTCLAGSGWEILTPGVNVTAIYWVP